MRTDALDALVAGVDAERCNGIFFSTRGRRAAADLMAGSDYDGDEFVVIADPQLVGNFAEAEAWEAPPPPPSGVPGVKAANPNPNPSPSPSPNPNPHPHPNPKP